jgi:asparagine synthase (glutamine-hydrolysing)
MCGIAGIIDFDKNDIGQQELNGMMDAIAHRGPDGRGAFFDDNLALGHLRLSIIDLSEKADQPIFSSDGNYVIIFNGEIYNYAEIKNQLLEKYSFKTHSDTEVLLNAYIEWGEDCLHKLNGMFSFVIFNKTSRTLFGARDIFGIKPFYYSNNGSNLVFASEIKALLNSGRVKSKMNERLLYDFVVFNRTDHSEETCFENIYNLRPGHCITVNLNSSSVSVKRYYTLPALHDNEGNYENAKKELLHLLNRTVQLHLVSDVEVGSALSGGIDSSSIVALMRKRLPAQKNINTFSAVYHSEWDKDEKKYVEALARHISIQKNFVTPNAEWLLKDLDAIIYQQEEPFASASIFASWCVYNEVNKKRIKVLLNGQGADEVFGYDYMAAFYFYELFVKFKYVRLVKEIYAFATKQVFGVKFTLQLFAFLLAPKFLKPHLIKASGTLANPSFMSAFSKSSSFFTIFFNSKTLNENVQNHLLYKLHHLLRVEDKNSMYFSVEARVPFLEKNLVEYALNIPSAYKVHNGEVKSILRDVMRAFLPKEINERKDKIGFATPMDDWFRTPAWVEYIDAMLNSDVQPMANYLSLELIKKKWTAHKEHRENNSQAIWKYVYLTRWYNIYFN